MKDIPTQLQGYTAMSLKIEEMLSVAAKNRPKTRRRVNENLAAFREGYFQGLVTAHCFSAYGEFPEANAEYIKNILNKKK